MSSSSLRSNAGAGFALDDCKRVQIDGIVLMCSLATVLYASNTAYASFSNVTMLTGTDVHGSSYNATPLDHVIYSDYGSDVYDFNNHDNSFTALADNTYPYFQRNGGRIIRNNTSQGASNYAWEWNGSNLV
jgi:hypothetical protein